MSSSPGMNPLPVPTVGDVDRIAALSDPVVRNLQITQCYAQLSAALPARTGLHANWCTFATWASKQAGQTIRQEDLARALEDFLSASPVTAPAAEQVASLAQRLGAQRSRDEIRRLVWEALDLPATAEHTSAAVARGNKKVFEEIGREFARFYAACLQDPSPDPQNIARFCESLRPGDPPEGQRYLRQAFSHLYQAIFEVDPGQRAELMLLANLEIGYHEQTRLQPEILAALDAPFVDGTVFVQRVASRLFPYGGALVLGRFLLTRLLGRPPVLELAIRALLAAVQAEIHRAITEALMSLRFPGGVRVRLGYDLSGEFPPALQRLTNPELAGLLAALDPSPDALQGSGALDWSDLPERLHFIVELFRLYQEKEELFEPPFTDEQVAVFTGGRVPEGWL